MIEGGYLKRPYAMETKDVGDIDEHNQTVNYTFVRVNKGQEWLFKAVAGENASRRDLFDINIFDEIEKAVRVAATSSDESQEAVSSQPAAKRYKSRRARDSITRVTMPLHPPNYDAPAGTVEVHVYNDGPTGKGQWIDVASIPWLVSYLRRDREHRGCVAPGAAVADAPDEPIPGVSITWSWATKEWVATFSDTLRHEHGSLPGDIRTSPENLTRDKWEECAHRHGMAVDFDASDARQRREVTRWFLLGVVETKLEK